MPTRIILEDVALAELKRMTQADSNPVISDALGILRQCVLAELWAASTPYSVGTVIQPNTPNGYRFVCVTAGTSGSTEPTFSTWRDSTTSDGTCLWREDGDEYLCLWDLQRAARMGWEEKLSKVVCAVDTKAGDQSFANSQLFEHCEKMISKYRSVMVA
jgi:hypothetical protein